VVRSQHQPQCQGIYTGPGYYIFYSYDAGGNRLTKRRYNYHPTSDPELQEYSVYVYDLDDPEQDEGANTTHPAPSVSAMGNGEQE
jgi:hypothetical protein